MGAGHTETRLNPMSAYTQYSKNLILKEWDPKATHAVISFQRDPLRDVTGPKLILGNGTIINNTSGKSCLRKKLRPSILEGYVAYTRTMANDGSSSKRVS